MTTKQWTLLVRAPLVELREKIELFRGSVDVSLVAIKNGLKQRSEAASARETLELLLDTFHVVSKTFLDGERTSKYLASETNKEILLCAATEITDCYYELAADLVSVCVAPADKQNTIKL
ncbi:conserved oligomeric Golgi complex subunit [Trifolium repens]|nr:conserved oligomeric Golgi complex subunit [Trifolium repens]